MKLITFLGQFNKFWVSLIAPLGVLLFCLAPIEGVEAAFIVTTNEWYVVVVALAASFGVYATPNKTK